MKRILFLLPLSEMQFCVEKFVKPFSIEDKYIVIDLTQENSENIIQNLEDTSNYIILMGSNTSIQTILSIHKQIRFTHAIYILPPSDQNESVQNDDNNKYDYTIFDSLDQNHIPSLIIVSNSMNIDDIREFINQDEYNFAALEDDSDDEETQNKFNHEDFQKMLAEIDMN